MLGVLFLSHTCFPKECFPLGFREFSLVEELALYCENSLLLE